MDSVPILDHGFLKLVESWGSDERIIESARMSTGKGFLGWVRLVRCTVCGQEVECENVPGYCNVGSCRNSPMEQVHAGDWKLLRFLHSKKHTTPFEMAGLTIEVQAPILVFREWHRHRTMSYSEMSARYTPLPDVNYIPSVERLMMASKINKQAGTVAGAAELTEYNASLFRACLDKMYAEQERLYQDALKYGVPKELARIHLPVGRYSRMRASANLLNWLRFLTLRMAPDAMYEIRQYANAVGKLVEQLFPRTWALFAESLPKP